MGAVNRKGTFFVPLDDLKNRGLVVKANELIEASYTMTIQEKRLILILAATVRMEDSEFNTVQINLRELNKLIGACNENIYSEIKGITRRLLSRVIEYKPEDGETIQTHWIEKAHYKEKKGYVEIRFSDDMKKYFLKLGSYFTKYRLAYALPLKSFYAVRLYELLKLDYSTNRPQAYYDLEDLKSKLGIVPPNKKLYGDFKRKILVSAQKQFLDLTDICFEFNEKKQGKKVIGLTFVIKPNIKTKAPEEAGNFDAEKDRALYERLTKYFCLSPKKAREIIKNYSADRLEENLAYVENEYKKGKIETIGPYTVKAIKENYKAQKSLFETEKLKAKEARKAEEKQKQQEEQNQIDYTKYWNSEVSQQRENLSEQDLNKIQIEAEEELSKTTSKRHVGYNFMLQHIIDKIIAQRAGLPSYEDWLAAKKS